MTHDELLDKIYWHWRKDPRGDGLQPMVEYRRAILAVVELHKPGKNDDGELGCRECSKLMMDGSRVLTYRYPCPTIKAIEKELV